MYLTENWRLKEQRYTLTGSRPEANQAVTFPPRPVTPRAVETFDFQSADPQLQDAVTQKFAEAI